MFSNIFDVSQLDAIQYHKTFGGQNFIKIIDVKKIDVCKVMDNMDNFPMFKGSIDWLNATFPNSVHKCPYLVRLKTVSIGKSY
jgi:hypothetical protein